MSLFQILLVPVGEGSSIPGVDSLHMHFIRSGMTVDASVPPNINPWAATVSGAYLTASAEQATHAWKPALRTAGDGINNLDAAEFDGVADHLLLLDKPLMRHQRVTSELDGIDFIIPLPAGEIHGCIETGPSAFIGNQTVISFADPLATNKYFRIHVNSSGALCIEANDAGTIDLVSGDTVLTTSSKYVFRAIWQGDGNAYGLWVNGVEQTLSVDSGSDSGKGPGDLKDLDNTAIGALVLSSGPQDFLEGKIGASNNGGLLGMSSSDDGEDVHSQMCSLYGV